MASPKISKTTEKRILQDIDRLVDMVQSGADPTDALVTVCQKRLMEPGHVRLLAWAYNTGRFNHQRLHSSGPLAKAASFPLADPEVALRRLYPDKEAVWHAWRNQVDQDHYDRPPPVPTEQKKVASVSPLTPPAPSYPRDPTLRQQRLSGLLEDLEHWQEVPRWQQSALQEKLAHVLDHLDHWFRRLDQGETFPTVYAYAGKLWGDDATRLLDKVAQANTHLRLDGPVRVQRVEFTKHPWDLLEKGAVLIQEGRRFLEEQRWRKREGRKAGLAIWEHLLPPARPLPWGGSILSGEKRAALAQAQHLLGEKPHSKPMSSPEHEMQLRRIRGRSILAELLSQDSFLKGEDPEKVVDLYNQISQLAPRAAERPLLVQALLHRYFSQGKLEPYDLDQLLDLDAKVQRK